MNSSLAPQTNPLIRLARALPSGAGPALSLGGRIAGAVLAAAVAGDQSYDRTRIFAIAIAALAALSCVPFAARLRGRLGWAGAGLVFFGGALLGGFGAGLLMVLCGTLAAIGAAVQEQQREQHTEVPSFFMGFGATAALVAIIVLAVEG